MKTVSLTCPHCASPVDAQSKFCSRCGNPVLIDDESQKLRYTYQQVDDARIREADVHQTVRLKELEIELLKMQMEARQKRFTLIFKLLTIIFYFAIMAGLLFLPLPTSDYQSIDPQGWLLFYIPLGAVIFFFLFRNK